MDPKTKLVLDKKDVKIEIEKFKKMENKKQNIGYVSTLAGNNTNPNCGQADGNLNIARFNAVTGLYFDSTNNQLLISDGGNNRFKILDFNCEISPFYLKFEN